MVEFSQSRDVERWLRARPREVAVAIGARAALRVIPALAKITKFQRGHVLRIFRITAVAWVASRHPDGRIDQDFGKVIHDYAGPMPSRYVSSAAHAVSSNFAPKFFEDAAYSVSAAAIAIEGHGNYFYQAASIDATELDHGVSALSLLDSPLWPNQIPRLVQKQWNELKSGLVHANRNWLVWTDWYEARLAGRPGNSTLEIARVLIPNTIWLQGAKVANSEIRRVIAEHEVRELPSAPAVPAQRPAAIETVWNRGKLSVPKTAAKSNLTRKKFETALGALQAELLELANDANAEGNIDKRPAEYLQRLAKRIPETAPPQDELFRLGHAETILAGYATVVAQQWPDFLAARYHAVSLQFDRTMRQSPLWREFVANAAKQTMSADQIGDSTSLATEAAKALQREEAPAFVDPVVPRALEELASALPVAPEPDAVEAGKELLAADLVESVNNTLKPIAEVALASAGDYAEGFGKGLKKAAKKQGPIDGEKAFKWLRRLAIGGVVAGAGSFVPFSTLLSKFPEAFGWLERVLQVLK